MNRLCNDKFLQSERPKITFKVNLHILAHVLFQQDQNCDDIIKENQKLKEEIKWLNDVITNNISQLADAISANSKDIMRNSDDIAANSATNFMNSHDIITQGKSIAANAANISANRESIATNADFLKAKTEKNAEAISTNVVHIANNSAASAKNLDDIKDRNGSQTIFGMERMTQGFILRN